MPTMTKRVNINAPVAIRTITPPIYGRMSSVVMSTGDILKCLCKRAVVDEILPDGSTVRLTMKNYYTDNGAGLDAKKNVVAPQPAKTPEVKKTEVKKSSNKEKAKETVNEVRNDAEIVTNDEPVAVVDPAIVVNGEEPVASEMTVDPAIEVVSDPNTGVEPTLEHSNEEAVESTDEEIAFVTGLSVEGDEVDATAQTESVTTVASTETEAVAKPATPKKKSSSSKKKSSASK